jgi:hypothetical protein
MAMWFSRMLGNKVANKWRVPRSMQKRDQNSRSMKRGFGRFQKAHSKINQAIGTIFPDMNLLRTAGCHAAQQASDGMTAPAPPVLGPFL